MKKTILALGAMLTAEMEDLERKYHLVRLWKEPEPEKTLKTVAQDVVAILSTFNGMSVTKQMIEALPNLEIIAQFGAGMNNIDVEAAMHRGVVMTSTPDVPTNDTADTALALMLAVLRRIVEADVYVRVGKWGASPFPMGSSLGGKTIGIIGMGRIGQAIAKRAAAFEMKIAYFGPREKPHLPYHFYSDLEDMARAVDILICACPGGEETRHIVNARILKALGPKGILINVARGSVVDTESLLAALTHKDIAGAGLDVYENEPIVPPALISMDNVVLLPHIGGHTLETKSAMGQLVIANINAHFKGEQLLTPYPSTPVRAA